jgi:hypothetical protein
MLFGNAGEGSPVAEGRLIDLSRGGARFRLDEYLAPHAPCLFNFYGRAGEVLPSVSRAHVVRTARMPRGGYITSIEFLEPLVAVDGPRVA